MIGLEGRLLTAARAYRNSFLAPATILFVLTVCIYWKITLTGQFTWLDSPDLVNQVLPWLREEARQWATGHVPIWDSHHWGGQSLIGQMQPGVLAPFNGILALFPLREDHFRLDVLNWYFVFSHYLGALFCYALCRDLGCTRASSIIAAVSFALSGYIGTNNWPQMINGAIWTPLVFLFLLRALRLHMPWFSAAAAGTALGVSTWAGHHQIPTFVAYAALLVFAIAGYRSKRQLRLFSGLLLCFSLFAFASGAAQLLPSHEYFRSALRWVGTENPVTWRDKVPYFAHANLSFNPSALLGMVVPGGYTRTNPFVGWTILTLAIIAVFEGWRILYVRIFACIALVGLILCLGGWSVYHRIVYSLLPGFDKARNISYAMFLYQFGLAVLAAFGLDFLLRREYQRNLLIRLADSLHLAAPSSLFYYSAN